MPEERPLYMGPLASQELSDIGSSRADDHEYLMLPEMLEDPYIEVALQASPSPDYVPAPVPMPVWTDSEVARLLAISSPPTSPLSLWSSPPPQIPFPPLPPILSPPSWTYDLLSWTKYGPMNSIICRTYDIKGYK
nr:hypothetical protein [Tanacetum cinerariifolium]